MGKDEFDKEGTFFFTNIKKMVDISKGKDPTVYVYIGDYPPQTFMSYEDAYKAMEDGARRTGNESPCFQEVIQQMQENPSETKFYSVSGFKKMVQDCNSYGKNGNQEH